MLVQSNMLPLGTKAPEFALADMATGKIKTLQQLAGEHGTFIIFICNHCPYVKHILPKLIKCMHFAQSVDIGAIAINANDTTKYPEDSQKNMAELCQKNNFTYLFDESQQTAKNYNAACTPDCFIFDNQQLCVYRGRFDASTPGNNIPPSGADILYILQSILTKQNYKTIEQHPSIGCNIKWKESE